MGSVELSYGRKRSGVTRVIAYKHALHALKAVSSIEILMPRNVSAMRKKVSLMKTVMKKI